MRFATPWFLLLLLVPLLRIWLRWRGERRRDGALAWVSAGVLEGIPRTPRARLTGLPRWLEFVGGALLVLAERRGHPDWLRLNAGMVSFGPMYAHTKPPHSSTGRPIFKQRTSLSR